MGDSDEAFLASGWRVPFPLSILLVGVGLSVRVSIEETPAFRAAQAQAPLDRPRRLPFLDVVTAYLTSYGTNPQGAALSRPVVLSIGIGAAVVFGATIAAAGILSDRFGRRKVIVISSGAESCGHCWPRPRRLLRQHRHRRHALTHRGALTRVHLHRGRNARCRHDQRAGRNGDALTLLHEFSQLPSDRDRLPRIQRLFAGSIGIFGATFVIIADGHAAGLIRRSKRGNRCRESKS